MNIYLQRVQDAITEATRGMDAVQLTRHPEGKWSAAEILEHLDRTYKTTVPHLQKCLDAGQPTAGRPTLAQRLAVGIVVGLGYMPPGRKAPQPCHRAPGAPADRIIRRHAPASQMPQPQHRASARHAYRTR